MTIKTKDSGITKARPGKKRLGLEPTPDPEALWFPLHHDGPKMLVLQWKLFLLLIVLLLITTQLLKKLMFLCHDRKPRNLVYRWESGEGEASDGHVFCIRLSASAIWLTFFF